MLTAEQIAEIRARAEAATPGPWTVFARDSSGQAVDYFLGFDIEGPEEAQRGMFANRADAEFIAHAREDIPALLAALKETDGD